MFFFIVLAPGVAGARQGKTYSGINCHKVHFRAHSCNLTSLLMLSLLISRVCLQP